jgi:hypothetical protein
VTPGGTEREQMNKPLSFILARRPRCWDKPIAAVYLVVTENVNRNCCGMSSQVSLPAQRTKFCNEGTMPHDDTHHQHPSLSRIRPSRNRRRGRPAPSFSVSSRGPRWPTLDLLRCSPASCSTHPPSVGTQTGASGRPTSRTLRHHLSYGSSDANVQQKEKNS